MKPKTLTLVTAALAAALALPLSLTAQSTRYKLVDVGTFGGPNAVVNGPTVRDVSNQGTYAGYAETSIPDPYAPNCVNPECLVYHAQKWRNGVVTDLGSLPGVNNSAASGISANGIIVGSSQNGLIDPLLGIPENRAVVWTRNNSIIDLGTLEGGNESFAGAVNSRGQVIGFSLNTISDPFCMVFPGCGTQTRTFLWQDGVMQDLSTLGGPDALPGQINERGQITGTSYTNSTPNPVLDQCGGFTTQVPTQDPFLWENGKMIDLGTLGGTCGFANALNNRGQVVGQSDLAGDVDAHAFLWDRGTLTDLGTLGGTFSVPFWLNDGGEAVGGATTPGDQLFHATLWRKGMITDLGTLPGDCFSVANAINSKGQIVGQSFSCDGSIERAVLWDKGSIIDLNTLIPSNSSLLLINPFDINDRGEIAGIGLLPDGNNHAALLIPCGGTEGCGNNTDSAARPNPASSTTSATKPTQGRHTTKEFVAQWRARLAQRNHIRGFGGSPRD